MKNIMCDIIHVSFITASYRRIEQFTQKMFARIKIMRDIACGFVSLFWITQIIIQIYSKNVEFLLKSLEIALFLKKSQLLLAMWCLASVNFGACWKLECSIITNSQTWSFLWSQPTAYLVCRALQSESGWWRHHSSQWGSFPPRSAGLDVISTHSGWRKNACTALWKRSQDNWQINLRKK